MGVILLKGVVIHFFQLSCYCSNISIPFEGTEIKVMPKTTIQVNCDNSHYFYFFFSDKDTVTP